MTLPDERYRAVVWAERFLQELAHNTKKYPRVPKTVRGEAYSILRHYPSKWDMIRAAEQSPEIFQEKMEPLHRLLLVHEESKKEQQ